jgi:NADH:ubiquinone oxidoreductase subunit 2 (subunit N)
MNFFKNNSKLISKVLGFLLIVAAVASLYWSEPKKSYTKASYSSKNDLSPVSVIGSSSYSSKKSSHEDIKKAYAERQEEQVRIFLILLAVSGAGFLIYGFISKRIDE